MSSYCTRADMEEMLPAADLSVLTDDDADGDIDAPIDYAISSASAEIDTYIGQYLPLTTVPAIVKKLCIDIAVYNLYSRVSDTIPETRQTRYDNAIRMLQKIADGALSLGLETGDDTPASAARVSARTKVFDSDTMDKF